MKKNYTFHKMKNYTIIKIKLLKYRERAQKHQFKL